MNYNSYIFTIFFVALCSHHHTFSSQNAWLPKISIPTSFFSSCFKSIPSFFQGLSTNISQENSTTAIFITTSLVISSCCVYLWRENSSLKKKVQKLDQNKTPSTLSKESLSLLESQLKDELEKNTKLEESVAKLKKENNQNISQFEEQAKIMQLTASKVISLTEELNSLRQQQEPNNSNHYETSSNESTTGRNAIFAFADLFHYKK